MKSIHTIGYEGASLPEFINTLKAAGVNVLLDIREIPLSRRKGFSKSSLREALQKNGIEYHHYKLLGSPKPIRDGLRRDGDYKKYFKAFDAYLKTQAGLLQELAMSHKGNVVLMCYERDPLVCHRLSVSNALQAITGKKPKHLGVLDQGGKHAEKRTGMYSRQSLSAA